MPSRRRRNILAVLGIAVAATAAWAITWKPFGGRITGARRVRIAKSPHWRDGAFRNLVPTRTVTSFSQSMKDWLGGKEKRSPDGPLPIHRLAALGPVQSFRAIWIGHSTVVVDIDGVRVVTDPIWSERSFPLIGPKRFAPPPIALDAVGPVDAVVISHDHWDHLDMPSVQALARGGATFFVPLGIGAHLERWSVPAAQIRELDWQEVSSLKGVRFVSLPARHYSGRRLIDSDASEWASWAIIGGEHRVWFSGDSGYDRLTFRDIGRTWGPFDLTLIKIGAYGATWPDIHMTPEEAVATHEDVGGRLLIPVHWATFNLAYHDWREPADRLERAASGRIAFAIPQIGEIVDPSSPPAGRRWWR